MVQLSGELQTVTGSSKTSARERRLETVDYADLAPSLLLKCYSFCPGRH
jgi:hypothetical protein